MAYTSNMSKQSLLRVIDADRDEHISFLQSLLRAKSPNPPGDCREAAAVVESYLNRHGVKTEIIALRLENPNVVAEFMGGAGKGHRLAMNGHMDVFPVSDKEKWTHGPWSGDLSEDGTRVFGRGAVDMKAGTAATVIAYAYLHARREHLRGSVVLSVVSDEETGGKFGSKHLLELDKARWGGDVMVNAEPGGLQSIRFGEKGTLRLTFEVQTPGAHGAYLNLDEGANRIMCRLVGRLVDGVEGMEPTGMPKSLRDHLKKPKVKKTIDEIMGEGASEMMSKPTVNIGTLHGGAKINMIPSSCKMEADIRLPIGMAKDEVMANIYGILKDFPQASVEVQEAASNPPNHCSEDHPMVGIMQQSAESVTGRVPVAIPGLGATDCKFWRYLGIPAYVFGVSPGGMAAVDESALIDEFIAVIKTHALSAWEYLDGQP